VNDRQGHAAGDELPVELGRDWRAELRGFEVLARFGGKRGSRELRAAASLVA
jgi:GGDEF domain-containing protein